MRPNSPEPIDPRYGDQGGHPTNIATSCTLFVADEDEERNGRVRRGKEANVNVGPVAMEKKRGERRRGTCVPRRKGTFLLFPRLLAAIFSVPSLSLSFFDTVCLSFLPGGKTIRWARRGFGRPLVLVAVAAAPAPSLSRVLSTRSRRGNGRRALNTATRGR
jgi:hypothetical protein